MREIGIVKQVQIQCSSLKLVEELYQIYDPAPLLTVESLLLSPQGVIGVLEDGAQIIDVHHADHPDSKYRGENGVSVSFTGHYAAMQTKFGAHLTEGIAGENILVEVDSVIKLADLGRRLAFQNPAASELFYLQELEVAAPCEPFSRFALQQSPPVLAADMKATLQFLHNGMRGFYAKAQHGTIMAGDRVFACDD